VSAGGLDSGLCKDLDYTVADGSTDQKAGPCGTLHFNKYKHAENPTLAIASTDIDLVTFDGSSKTTFKFNELNDPVMGGQSSGTWSLSSSYGIMDGHVEDVPSLKAPGFIKAAADGAFAEASAALGGDLLLEVRSSTPEYKGFRVTFASGTMSPSYSCAGGGSIPFSRGCFKAKFSVPAGDAWSTIRIPFSSFSDKWSPATGEQTTTCAADAEVCPTKKALAGVKRIELWAEGADGKVSSTSACPLHLSSHLHAYARTYTRTPSLPSPFLLPTVILLPAVKSLPAIT
jgi:hypothetical protein